MRIETGPSLADRVRFPRHRHSGPSSSGRHHFLDVMSFSTALSSIAFASSFVHGRIYQTIDDVRAAIGGFVACYNAEWLIEKNGLRSPREARATRNQALMKVAA